MRPLRDVVGDLIWQVQPGSVTTYGDLARALGDIVAARAVAAITMDELDPEDFPTHRVVRKDGTLGNHPLGESEKSRRLTVEGISIQDGRVEGMPEMRQMLTVSGFAHIRSYGSLGGDQFGAESARLVIVAEKRER